MQIQTLVQRNKFPWSVSSPTVTYLRFPFIHRLCPGAGPIQNVLCCLFLIWFSLGLQSYINCALSEQHPQKKKPLQIHHSQMFKRLLKSVERKVMLFQAQRRHPLLSRGLRGEEKVKRKQLQQTLVGAMCLRRAGERKPLKIKKKKVWSWKQMVRRMIITLNMIGLLWYAVLAWRRIVYSYC